MTIAQRFGVYSVLAVSYLIPLRLFSADTEERKVPVIWRQPSDLEGRDLLYGSGGKKDAPAPGPYKFVKEDLNGSNPKFTVEDSNGTKWKVKLGAEAKPETVAARFVWAVGYFADEDYFVERAILSDVPFAKLRRVKGWISSDSVIKNARFEREGVAKKTDEEWTWKKNTFSNTRELNGLRVLMATLNNWDLKDENNAIYEDKKRGDERIYIISDLGATFGTPNLVLGHEKSRGNVEAFERSKFIAHKTADHVDFASPGRPTWLALVNPKQYFMRVKIEWIGRNVPRTDARWMGMLMARLSPSQLRDAFRAAGYSPEEVERYARVMEARIAQLNAL